MGLIATAINAASSAFADQWKEYFVCEALAQNVLMVKGEHKGKTSLFSGNNASDNVISNGSGIVVADGQCVILVSQGKVVDVCADPGCYTFDASAEPSFFCDSLGQGFKNVWETIKERFKFGGEVPQDQRVYYLNTKEITDNKFGTNNPIIFRVVDKRINLDVDVDLRCNGLYSYKITNPIAFYENVAGNVASKYVRDNIDAQLKTEFVSALQPALAKLAAQEIRPSEIPAHVEELCSAMNSELSEKWLTLRGLEVVSVAMNPISLSESDAEMIKTAQKTAMYKDPSMAAAATVEASTTAMKDAANNSAGAVNGFMGVNMAQSASGLNVNDLYAQATTSSNSNSWTCECGANNNGNFCTQCGKAKPAGSAFCSECGKELSYGTKFCSNCGKEVK